MDSLETMVSDTSPTPWRGSFPYHAGQKGVTADTKQL